jgi:uncharacterized protein DUF2510
VTGANRPSAEHPPGWYPDPWHGGRQQRYWDGDRWTAMTAPARLVAPSGSTGPGRPPGPAAAVAPALPAAAARPHRVGRIFSLTLAGFALAVVVVVYAVARGQDVKRVSPTGEIEFYSSGGGTEFSSEEIRQRQDGMDERLSQLEQRARDSAGSAPAATGPNLTGTWFGDNGLRYDIEQYGTAAVIQEVTVYGVTAAGYGQVDQTGVTFSYQAVDGSTGIADLTLVADDRLEGSFDNDTSGTSVPATLTR